jgi:glycosyltransferase involved in cell wall biosynthesis/predicted metal-dependent phosphoesterase TrpH
MKSPRCDLHVHSSFSKSSGYWFLRALQAPESFTPPEMVYEKARDRGMDFVTITDANSIEGVLRISDLPGVFLGEEITSFLHGSRAAVHILAWGFLPEDAEEIARLRDTFESLVEFLDSRKLPWCLAHPLLFPGGGALSFDDFQRVVRAAPLLEGLSGGRPELENEGVRSLATGIRGPSFRGFIGGSDDHCGRFIGLTWTTVTGASTSGEFLAGLLEGRGVPGGRSGSAIRAAYAIYSIAYSFYRDRLLSKRLPLFATATADRFFRPGASSEPTLWHRLDHTLHQIYHKAVATSDPGPEAFLLEELLEVGKNLWARAPETSEDIDERTFRILNNTTNRLIDRFGGLLLRRASDGRLFDALEAASALLPVLLLNAPYPIAYGTVRKGKAAAAEYARNLPGFELPRRSKARAWFTDTIDDLNGVSRTLQKLSHLAVQKGHRLAVVTSQSRPLSFEGWVVNLSPVREFPVPDYESKLLSIPPFLELLRFLDDNDFERIYISTPGPVGLAALGAAKLLGIPAVGIYHTDLPRHAGQIVQDGHVGEFASAVMSWFYSATDLVMVPSLYYMRELEGLGVPGSRMRIFPRGIDPDAFSPAWRDAAFFDRFGASPGSVRLVYVGRISREKDLDVLADAYMLLREAGKPVELFMVGDGPFVGDLALKLSGKGCHFCGVLRGEELSKAYASGDIFVFPSTTDTFGNVVLEAQASGLSAVVTDMGGPMEIVAPGRTGLVARGRSIESFADAVSTLVDDPGLRRRMSEAARELASERTWEKAFDLIWNVDKENATD